MTVYAGQLDATTMLNGQLTTSGGNSGELDLQGWTGTALLSIDDRASGTAAATIAITESETTGGTFTAVPADALFNLSTGLAATFSDLSTSASNQVLGLHCLRLKRFIRVEVAGTSISHDLAIVGVVGKKYAE